MAIKWRRGGPQCVTINRKQSRMWRGRLLRACLVTIGLFFSCRDDRASGASPGQFRSSGGRLSSVRRSPRAIRRIGPRCASATGAAGPGVSTTRPRLPSGAVCWLKNNVPARTQSNCCVSGVRGAGVVEPRTGAERSLDRPLRRRLQEFRVEKRRGRRCLQGGLHRRQQVPGLDLCAAGIYRDARRTAS